MVSEHIKQQILNGAPAITRSGYKVVFYRDCGNTLYPLHFKCYTEDSVVHILSYTKELEYLANNHGETDLDIIGLWEESTEPEPFNLEKALKGEPVLLRNGLKAEILKALDKPDARGFQYFGLSYQTSNNDTWYHEQAWNENFKGSRLLNDALNNYDIIGMWQEPERPTVTLILPCPLLKLENKQTFFRLSYKGQIVKEKYGNLQHQNKYLKEGLCFASEEDALTWKLAKQNNRR